MNVNHSDGVNSPKQGFVIVSSAMGIYLGSCLGLGFWSKLDPAGQGSAVTFESVSEAEDYMKSWDGGRPDGVSFKPVFPDEGIYASIRACVAAGLGAWSPDGPTLSERGLALMNVATRRREILGQEGLSQGLGLVVGPLDANHGTDEELHVVSPFEFDGHALCLTYSLGYDPDEDGYRPYVEIAVGPNLGAPEFSERRGSGRGDLLRSMEAMEDAFTGLDEQAGDLCVKALAWCQAASEKRRNHQVPAGG